MFWGIFLDSVKFSPVPFGFCRYKYSLKMMIQKKSSISSKPTSRCNGSGRPFPSYGGDFSGKMNVSEPGLENFHRATEFYLTLAGKQNLSFSKNMRASFALQLSRIILETLCGKCYDHDSEGCLCSDFSDQCLCNVVQTSLRGCLNNDDDLVLIHIKQMVLILRAAGLVVNRDNVVAVTEKEICDEALFFRLLNAFWNNVAWDAIFPSNPEAARNLKEERHILKDLLLRYGGYVEVDSFSNDFFELTGLTTRNNIFLISFMDFYVYTWLRHFNILTYRQSSQNAPVTFFLTDEGKRLLASLNN